MIILDWNECSENFTSFTRFLGQLSGAILSFRSRTTKSQNSHALESPKIVVKRSIRMVFFLARYWRILRIFRWTVFNHLFIPRFSNETTKLLIYVGKGCVTNTKVRIQSKNHIVQCGPEWPTATWKCKVYEFYAVIIERVGLTYKYIPPLLGEISLTPSYVGCTQTVHKPLSSMSFSVTHRYTSTSIHVLKFSQLYASLARTLQYINPIFEIHAPPRRPPSAGYMRPDLHTLVISRSISFWNHLQCVPAFLHTQIQSCSCTCVPSILYSPPATEYTARVL